MNHNYSTSISSLALVSLRQEQAYQMLYPQRHEFVFIMQLVSGALDQLLLRNAFECAVSTRAPHMRHHHGPSLQALQLIASEIKSIHSKATAQAAVLRPGPKRNAATAMPFASKTPATPTRPRLPHKPCLIRSASCLFPNSHAFRNPCSERSRFFIDVMSCAGGLLTREATVTGSVSRMMPSSTSSSTARDCGC